VEYLMQITLTRMDPTTFQPTTTSVTKDNIFVTWYCTKCGVDSCCLNCPERVMENIKCGDDVTNLILLDAAEIEDLDQRIFWAKENRCRIGWVMGYGKVVVQFEDDHAHVHFKIKWGTNRI
jgi:hypothetical protein